MSNLHLELDDFMLYCESKNLSKKTLHSYEQTLKLFFIFLEKEYDVSHVKKVKASHVRNYVKHLRERGKYTVTRSETGNAINYPDRRNDHGKPLSDTTVANYLRNIKVFFNFLQEERVIKDNPCENIQNIKPQRKKKPLLSEQEIKKVLSTMDITTFYGYRSWMMCRLTLDTGIRAGECCELIPEDIDFKHNALLIRNPKNHMERYVYFSNKMKTDLKRWVMYRDRFCDSEYLFPTTRGTKLDVRNFERSVREAGRKVGVAIHPHQLRNNFAKYYLINGGDFATLSRILGHSSVDVTMKAYLDFTDREVGKKYQKHSPLNNLDI
ncbi:tyrosine-type recombinase/integrase [Bacillus sp. Hm123]|uniref:tyrosine-type recombinase/integrase n=1 Tax=Bacillus sp. Hm123 TaxID=3450745 RepID=UPI003F427CB1